jgi:hypothetical protein
LRIEVSAFTSLAKPFYSSTLVFAAFNVLFKPAAIKAGTPVVNNYGCINK